MIKARWTIYRVIGRFHHFLIKLGIPICHGQEGPCFNKGKKRRQRTQYHDDELNWVFLCDKCMEINQEYWNDMWAEYYSQVM